jgi:hypothetical protein
MQFRLQSLVVCVALAFGAAAVAQQDGGAPPQQGQGGGYGQGRGGGRGMGQIGRGVTGTVTEVAADHYVVKTETGEVYTVHFSANTRIMKTVPRPAGAANDSQPGAGATRGGGNGGRDGFGGGRMGQPPVAIKATDIKVGDVVMAGGEIDDAAKSVGAVMVMQLDPQRAKEMREMQANFGKTWLMGRVTAVNEAKVTLDSNVDRATHTFTADENTTFRKRRDPITLADVQVGDMVRVEGSVKGGAFMATSVMVMGPGPGQGMGAGQGAGAAAGQRPPQTPQQ